MPTPDDIDGFAKSLDGLNADDLGISDTFQNPKPRARRLNTLEGLVNVGGLTGGVWYAIELEVECEYEFDQGEPRTWDHPGDPGSFTIHAAHVLSATTHGAPFDPNTGELTQGGNPAQFQQLVGRDLFGGLDDLPFVLTNAEAVDEKLDRAAVKRELEDRLVEHLPEERPRHTRGYDYGDE